MAASTGKRDARVVIVAIDVDYREKEAVAACVGFRAWADAASAFERVVRVEGEAAAYEPGKLFMRELPFVLAALKALDDAPAVVVVDGYVMLGATKRGLGAHLYDAIAKPVVGVAKNEFIGAPAERVVRGSSKKPLFVTAIGMTASEAAVAIGSMHGPHRIPTMLARADALCRAAT
jgi:deoxyribonuclease V